MKHVYVLATALFSMLTIINGASAQSTYTAVRNGNWSIGAGSGTPWDPNGKPPKVCNNCTIIVNSNVKLTMDAQVTLTGTSVLQLGSDGVGTSQIDIIGSGAPNFMSSHNIVLSSAGLDNVKLRLLYNNVFIDATGATTWDGVFAENGSYLKQVGNTPWTVFDAAGTPELTTTISGGNFLRGPSTLLGSGPLPITLSGFSASVNSDAVDLTWTTAQEFNSDHFAVERSTDGGTRWFTLANVSAAGYSSLPLNYAYTDDAPAAGVNEYRLESIDRDGKTSLSPIKVIRTGLIAALSVFPNPASDVVNVSFKSTQAAGMLSIRLMNQFGQILTEKKLENAAGTTVSLPISNYPQGNYLIVVSGADGSSQIGKLFISRK
jgi:hypothetical protein